MKPEPVGEWVEVAPWKSRMLLLLSHEGTWAGTVREKRAMLASGGPLFVVWLGQWSTTVRTLDGAELEEVARRVG